MSDETTLTSTWLRVLRIERDYIDLVKKRDATTLLPDLSEQLHQNLHRLPQIHCGGASSMSGRGLQITSSRQLKRTIM
jgi:hypothetical protein